MREKHKLWIAGARASTKSFNSSVILKLRAKREKAQTKDCDDCDQQGPALTFSEKMLALRSKSGEGEEDREQNEIERELKKIETEFYKGVDLEIENPFDFLEEGSYFGEIALFSKFRRTCSIKTMNHCIFATLDRSVTQEIE